MALKVDESLTRKVAELARLELTAKEVQEFTVQLGEVLGLVGTLQEVNVEGVEPMTHSLDLATPLRPDEVHAFPLDEQGRPAILHTAPEVIYEGFKVPPIL